ncbi:MAG: SpoVR family protein [bacterium]|nr:SpoVR family protein [bacterium]
MIKFPTELKEWKYLIERKAKRAGLKFFPTIFEIVTYDQMNEMAAFSGFPSRWSHWQFGQEYESLKKYYSLGLQKIYEMVINNDPCYAYLLEGNGLTDQKIVIAHVYAHNDFFKNNIWFSPVPRKMLDEFGNHRYQLEAIKEKVGEEKVDEFLDKVLSIDWLIDDHSLMIKREPEKLRNENGEELEEEKPRRLGTKDTPFYLDSWLNPAEYLKSQEEEAEKKKELQKMIERGLKIPLRPTRDILKFLIDFAPLEQWQKYAISIIREENYYFVPQMQTKIMNEGWATLWHDRIMTNMGICQSSEVFNFADHSAGTLTGFPYKLGFEIFRDIEYRWNTGRHGKIWEECEITEIKENWDEFIVFKTLVDESRADIGNLDKKWRGFCTFRQALKEGKYEFPKELCADRNIVQQWLEYQSVALLLLKQKKYLKEAKTIWREAFEACENAKKSEVCQKKSTFEKQYKTRLFLAKEEIKEIAGIQKYLKKLFTIKEAIKTGELPLVSQSIPTSYLEFAKNYPEPVKLGKGLEKIFEVREIYNDLTFIEEFFNEEICFKLKLFTYEPGGGGVSPEHYGIVSRAVDKVRKKLLFERTHHGQPIIELVDANYEMRGEMYLKHLHEGMDIHVATMREVMKILFESWQKPIHLETIITEDKTQSPLERIRRQMNYDPNRREEEEEITMLEGERIVFTHNGKELVSRKIEDVKVPDPFD